MLIGIKSRR